MSKNKGITLIALIITIIVMLILVAVTINLAVNGGLFGYAGNAAKDTELAKEKEVGWTNVESNMTTDQLIEKYTTDKEADLAKLRAYFLGRPLNEIFEEEALYDNQFILINNDIIPNANNSIEILGRYDSYQHIKYNNRKYELFMVIEEDYDDSYVVSVDDITGITTIFGMAYGGGIIRFETKPNQTWLEWCNDPENTDDLTFTLANGNPKTLKQMISDSYEFTGHTDSESFFTGYGNRYNYLFEKSWSF